MRLLYFLGLFSACVGGDDRLRALIALLLQKPLLPHASSAAMSLFLNIMSTAAVATVRSIARRAPAAGPRMAAASQLGGPEITVLGGGFGGLYTALRLQSLDWEGGATPRVTLVDRNDRFAFSPMLYELATGTAASWEVSPLYESLLEGTDIEFVRGEVVGLDERDRVVRLTDGSAGDERYLPYDQCVLAFGAQASGLDRVPGAAEHAQPFYTAADAMAVRAKLKELRACTDRSVLRVSVVGGGYIGVELAANLASALPASELLLTLVHRSDQLLPEGKEHSRNEAERRLAAAGVDVLLQTSVARVGAESLRLVPNRPAGSTSTAAEGSASEEEEAGDGGYDLPADLTLWTAGSAPAPIVSTLDLPTAASGRIVVDSCLRVDGRPRLFALGDATTVTDAAGDRAPSTAQAAMQQADYAAWNVRAALRADSPVLPFRYANLGEMLSLGEDAASVSALGTLVKLSGPLAYASRRAVYAARMPTVKQAAKVGISWGIDAAFAAARKAMGPQR